MDEEQIEPKNELTNNDKKFEIPFMFYVTCLLLAGQYFLHQFLKTET